MRNNEANFKGNYRLNQHKNPAQCFVSCQIPGPARMKGFSVPYGARTKRIIARYRACIWKSTVRVLLVLCLLLLVWLEMHKLQFNLSRIFKNIYEVTVFVINWACWGAKLQLLSYEISGQRMSQLLSCTDSTVGFFLMTLLCIRFIPFAK